jgi:hypothetical protein
MTTQNIKEDSNKDMGNFKKKKKGSNRNPENKKTF